MPQSKAHMEATDRYNQKAYDNISLRLRKDADVTGDTVRAHAKAMGESVNAFMLRAVIETMERDKEHTK